MASIVSSYNGFAEAFEYDDGSRFTYNDSNLNRAIEDYEIEEVLDRFPMAVLERLISRRQLKFNLRAVDLLLFFQDSPFLSRMRYLHLRFKNERSYANLRRSFHTVLREASKRHFVKPITTHHLGPVTLVSPAISYENDIQEVVAERLAHAAVTENYIRKNFFTRERVRVSAMRKAYFQRRKPLDDVDEGIIGDEGIVFDRSCTTWDDGSVQPDELDTHPGERTFEYAYCPTNTEDNQSLPPVLNNIEVYTGPELVNPPPSDWSALINAEINRPSDMPLFDMPVEDIVSIVPPEDAYHLEWPLNDDDFGDDHQLFPDAFHEYDTEEHPDNLNNNFDLQHTLHIRNLIFSTCPGSNIPDLVNNSDDFSLPGVPSSDSDYSLSESFENVEPTLEVPDCLHDEPDCYFCSRLIQCTYFSSVRVHKQAHHIFDDRFPELPLCQTMRFIQEAAALQTGKSLKKDCYISEIISLAYSTAEGASFSGIKDTLNAMTSLTTFVNKMSSILTWFKEGLSTVWDAIKNWWPQLCCVAYLILGIVIIKAVRPSGKLLVVMSAGFIAGCIGFGAISGMEAAFITNLQQVFEKVTAATFGGSLKAQRHEFREAAMAAYKQEGHISPRGVAMRVLHKKPQSIRQLVRSTALPPPRDGEVILTQMEELRNLPSKVPKNDLAARALEVMERAVVHPAPDPRDLHDIGSSESDYLEDEPPSYSESESAMDYLYIVTAFAKSLNIKDQLLHLNYLRSLLTAARDMSAIFKFLFELIPVFVQTKLLEYCPDIAITLLYSQSKWKSYHIAMEKMEKRLANPDATMIREAELLLDKATAYLTVHCSEGWATHAEAHLSAFKTVVRNAHAALKTCALGATPLMVYLAGLPGIGKTRCIQQINSFLTGCYTQTPSPYRVYRVPPGAYWENIGDAIGAYYPEFAGTSDAANLQQLDEWMALADAAFKPNGASIANKDKVHIFNFVTAASNFLYPRGTTGFNNYDALYRRADFRIYVKLDKDFASELGETATIAEKMATLKELKPEVAATFPHLRFTLVLPSPFDKGQIEQYNAGYLPHETLDPKFFTICRNFGFNQSNLKFEHLLAVLHAYAANRKIGNAHLTAEETSYMLNTFSRITGIAAPPPVDPSKVKAEHELYFKVGMAFAIGLPTTALLAGAAYGIYKWYRANPIESLAEYGNRPRDFKAIARQNRLKGIPTVAPAASLQEGATPGVMEEQFMERVNANVVSLRCGAASIHGFALDDSSIITLAHGFSDGPKLKYGAMVELTFFHGQSSIVRTFELLKERVFFPTGEDNDTIIIRLPQPMPGIRSSLGWFVTQEELRNVDRDFTLVTSTGIYSGILTGTMKSTIYALKDSAGNKIPGTKAGWSQTKLFTTNIKTTPGDCGCPVWAFANGSPKIVGIHIARHTQDTSLEVYLPKECLAPHTYKNSLVQLDVVESISEGALLPHLFTDMEIPDSILPQGNFCPITGLAKNISSSTKTQFKETRFKDSVPTLPCRVAPSVLDPKIIKNMEEKYGLIRWPIPNRLLKWAELASDLQYPVPKEPLRMRTLVEACNMIPRTGSVGFGWTCKRSDLLEVTAEDKVIPNGILKERVENILRLVDEGKVPMAVLTPCLKDETLKHEKIFLRKSRTFQISPIEWLVFGNMAFGEYCDYIHQRPLGTPNTVGVDPASHEWHDMFHPVFTNNTRPDDVSKLVDLDYKAMEATITWQLFDSFLRHTTRYYRDEGTFAWKCRKAYLMAMCNSGMAMKNIVYWRDGGNPSGMNGTIDVNTYSAGIYAAYAFVDIFPASFPADYVACIKSRFCGDDTVLGVSEIVAEKYNFLTIYESLQKLNVTITPAKKDEDPTPFVPQTEITFCKKQILYSDELHALVPFVSFHTLLDQLSYTKDNSLEGMVQCINSALQWSFFRGNKAKNGQIPFEEPTFDDQREFFCQIYPEIRDSLFTYEVFTHRYYHPTEHRAEALYRDFDIMPVPAPLTKLKMSSHTSRHCDTIQSNNNTKFPSLDFEAPTESSLAEFGLDLGPFHIGIGDAPDMHGPTNPPVVPPAPSSFVPDIITNTVLPILEDALSLAESGTVLTQPVRDGELIAPSFDSKTSMTVLGDTAGVLTRGKPEHTLVARDELAHKTWASVPVITNKFMVNDPFTVEALLYSENMSPFTNITTADGTTGYYLSPVEVLARMHAFWHGSLRYRLQYVGPRESTVRVAVCFLFGESSVPHYSDAIQYPTVYITYDSKKRSQTWEVPDISPYRWKLRDDLLPWVAQSYLQKANGTIAIFQVSGVSGINVDLTSAPYFNLWKSGGSDFAVYRFAPTAAMSKFGVPSTQRKKKGFDADRSLVHVSGPVARMEDSYSLAESDMDATMANLPGEEQQVLATSTTAADALSAGTVMEAATPQTAPALNPAACRTHGIKNSTVESLQISKLPAKFSSLATIALDTGMAGTVVFNKEVPLDFLIAQSALIVSTGRYFRGDLRLRLTINTGAFSGGLIFVYFVPYNVNLADTNISRITSLPHAELDVATNKPIDFFLPYAYLADYYSAPDIKDGNMPAFGSIVVFVQNFFKPVTTPKPTTLFIQGRWENLQPFIPITVPPCVSNASSARQSMAKRAIKPALKSYKPGYSIAESAMDATVTNMVAADSPTNPAEQRSASAVVPLSTNKVPNVSASFADEFVRPTLYFAKSYTIDTNTSIQIDLNSLYEGNGASDGAGQGNVFDTLKSFFAAYIGDAQYNIILRGGGSTNLSYCVGSLVTSEENMSSTGLTPMVPSPYIPTNGEPPYWPARLGTTIPADSFVIPSELPLTTTQLPGKLEVIVPFMCQTRYAPVQNWGTGAETLVAPMIKGFIRIWNPSTEKQDITVEVWRNPARGTRLSHFTGLIPFYFDYCINPTVADPIPKKVNYTGSWFTLPT